MSTTHEIIHRPPVPAAASPAALRVGVDIARASNVADAVATFGDRYLGRIFTAREVAYALAAPALAAERLAARFAAKEAAIKAFDLSEAGVAWSDIEVLHAESGACALVLHDRVQDLVAASGVTDIALSLSHEGDYAIAFVAAR